MSILHLLNSPEDFMLPCLSKQILGMECFGCGLQRSTLLIFRGEFIAAFKMYPAIYTLIMFALFLGFNAFFKIKYSEKIKITLVVLNIIIIVISYLLKLTL